MNIEAQKRKLNQFGFAATLRLPDAVWVVLLVARGFPLWQAGMAEGVFHVVSLLGEVPSGMAADLLGRRRTMAAAGICGAVSAGIMACSTSFFMVCLSMAFSALACNLISGSDEALLYDSLKQAGREQDYLKASADYTQMQNLAFVLSNALGGLAAALGHVGLYLVDGAVCIWRTLAALSLAEPTVTAQQATRTQNPFAGLGRRFAAHVSTVGAFLVENRRILPVLLADGLISLPGYLTLMFLQQRLSDLGVATLWLGLPVMLVSLGRMLGVAAGRRLKPRRLRGLYVVLALVVGAGTACAGAAPLVPAIAGAMLTAAAQDAWVLHEQRYLNDLFPSDQRATLISVNAMAYSLLMIGASPVVGWLGDAAGSAGAGLCALGGVVALGGAACALTLRKPAAH